MTARRGIVHHFAGPTLESNKDAARLTAKASAPCLISPDPAPSRGLLVAATGHTGKRVVWRKCRASQRINTQGGTPPAVAECTAANNAPESRAPYSADYYFYKPQPR